MNEADTDTAVILAKAVTHKQYRRSWVPARAAARLGRDDSGEGLR